MACLYLSYHAAGMWLLQCHIILSSCFASNLQCYCHASCDYSHVLSSRCYILYPICHVMLRVIIVISSCCYVLHMIFLACYVWLLPFISRYCHVMSLLILHLFCQFHHYFLHLTMSYCMWLFLAKKKKNCMWLLPYHSLVVMSRMLFVMPCCVQLLSCHVIIAITSCICCHVMLHWLLPCHVISLSCFSFDSSCLVLCGYYDVISFLYVMIEVCIWVHSSVHTFTHKRSQANIHEKTFLLINNNTK